MAKTILTGIRANNDLHLGNYLGAIKPMVDIQRGLAADDHLFMFVPDLHSFTTPIDHGKLYETTINNARIFIAAGIDPDHEQTLLYRQSRIPAHSELAWILGNFTYFGEASRMTEFKDKSARMGNKSVSVGLFSYPILMAADIFLYDAEYVPLGDDQKQHMELARTLAERFNAKFGDVLTVPKSWVEQLKFTDRGSIRIRSLSDPTKKMSKSVDDPKGTIQLTEDPEGAAIKIRSATTDSLGKVNFDFEKQPGVTNLLQMLALFSSRSQEEVNAEWQGRDNYGELKEAVAGVVHKFLSDFQAKLDATSPASAEKILASGEERAGKIAEAKLELIQKAVGLRR